MAHQVDCHVGKRIRQRRWLVGMTQQQLAEKVGIKFQQIQKYETGANRVSASRLWDIADALDVPVHFFFEGLDKVDEEPARAKGRCRPTCSATRRRLISCGPITRSPKSAPSPVRTRPGPV